MGSREPESFAELRDLTLEGGRGQRSATLMRRVVSLGGSQGPDFPGGYGCVFTDKPTWAEDKPN